MPSNTVVSLPGFYGKLPSRGDFVARNLTRSFIDPWDQWLQGAINDSRKALAENWLDSYLTSPLWHFVLAPGLCGKTAMAGVMMPSVDRVGRYYPLVLAATLTAPSPLFDQLSYAQTWHQRTSELALTALEDQLDMEAFTQKVVNLGSPPSPTKTATLALALALTQRRRSKMGKAAWHYALGSLNRLNEIRDLPSEKQENSLTHSGSLWSTQGSKRIEPCLLACQALPEIQAFGAMLDGRWGLRGWEQREID